MTFILCCVFSQWQHSPADLLAQGQAIVEALDDASSKLVKSGNKSPPDCKAAVHKCFSTLTSTYDQKMGGFGRAPKFPKPGWLLRNMSLRYVVNVKLKLCR